MKIYWIVNIFFIVFYFFVKGKLLAHHKIYSPRVEEGRQSLEWRGHFDLDNNESMDKSHHHVLETEYSWTNFWQSELEFHISDKEDTPLDWEKTEFQNQVQLFDFDNFANALYFSYNFVSEAKKGDEIEYKYLNEFTNQYFTLTSNFIFEKQVGTESSGGTEFSFSNYLFFNSFSIYNTQFGILGFSELGYIGGFNTFQEQEHHYGIQFEKDLNFKGKEFEFAVGYLHGFSNTSSNHKILWNTEFEF